MRITTIREWFFEGMMDGNGKLYNRCCVSCGWVECLKRDL